MKFTKLLSILFLLVVCSCSKESDDPLPIPSTLDDAIENIFQPMVDDATTIGASIGFMKPGGDTQMYFFGKKSLDSADSPDENTLFEIGSITKTFTATIMADMIEKGKIKLDDPVDSYFPEINQFPKFGDNKITFKHLANHTSALPRLPYNLLDEGFDENNPYVNYTSEMLFDFLDGFELTEEVGTVEEYSNLATGMLGYLMNRIDNKPLGTLFQENIFDPLDMKNACVRIPENESNFAQPYDEDLKPVGIWDMSEVTLGAGGIKANMSDMLKYLKANLGRGPSSIIETMAITHETTQSINYPLTVGLCWNNIYKEEDNTTLTWHDGETAGTVSFIGFIKELDIGVVLLFNTRILDRSGDPLLHITKGIDVIEAIRSFEN